MEFLYPLFVGHIIFYARSCCSKAHSSYVLFPDFCGLKSPILLMKITNADSVCWRKYPFFPHEKVQ